MPDINKAYSWAIETCNTPNIGYSQPYRNQQTVNGITYYDCSSFIWYSLIAGGFDCVGANGGVTWPFTTYTMPGVLQNLGFTHYNSADVEWLPGDILLSSEHTEMCYTGGQAQGVCMGAHTNSAPLEYQVSIGSSSGNSEYVSTPSRFPDLWRYGEGGATGYGYSIYVISALCGNSWRESNINPGLHQIGGTAFGLFQWDGGRRDSLYQWLSDNGYEQTSPDGQMTYLVVEDDWIQNYGPWTSLQDFLTTDSTDIAELTTAFCRNWERAGVEDLENRIKWANQCFDYIQAHANDTSINTWVITDYYLTEEQILNNAVLMYRFYSAGGGGGGTIGQPKKGMPLFMYLFL